ncbi:MAG: hypothetical protein QF381_03025 [Nitrososphaerales archaeon]|jgi:hypothetical protein|nr:hypothetical protein [Nitrososphaerales archaeon]
MSRTNHEKYLSELPSGEPILSIGEKPNSRLLNLLGEVHEDTKVNLAKELKGECE